jgi:hypothetical protein
MVHLSRHAERRCQQRGIANERLAAFLENVDVDKPIGRNCRLLKVSREIARTIPGGEWLASMMVIESEDTGKVVTVMNGGRHYRRIRPGRRHRRSRAARRHRYCPTSCPRQERCS